MTTRASFARPALAAATLACSCAFAQQGTMRVQIFDPVSDIRPTAINDRGVVAGSFTSADGSHAAVIRRDGIRDLGPGQVAALNNRGQAAGWMVASGLLTATMWGPARTVVLGTEGVGSQASDINDLGQVVGTTYSPPGQLGQATLWHRGMATYLGPGLGIGINNLGAVAGIYSVDVTVPTRAAVWDDGRMTLLETTSPMGSFAYAINDAGQVVGTTGGAATLWQGGVSVYLERPSGSAGPSMATGINEAGDIVGHALGYPPNIDSRAVLWRASSGHVPVDVNTLLRPGAPQAGWVLTSARSINRDGEMVGAAMNRFLCNGPTPCATYGFVLTRSALPDEYPVPTLP